MKIIAIVIPAYNPDERLLTLVAELQSLGCRHILVVDDGSDEKSSPVFAALESGPVCPLFRHPRNSGKGAALKSGFREVLRLWPECAGIVTADADGQHSAGDIYKVCQALETHPDSLVLGVRDFSDPAVPTHNKLGNRITSAVFRLIAGRSCPDTQTGLRGLPPDFSTWINVPGDRYEYEMNVLLHAARSKVPFAEVAIRTLYQDRNRSSHFDVWRDSFRIYLVIAKFGFSSLLSALLDLSLFTLFMAWPENITSGALLTATILARVLSGALNYFLNRKWVFSSNGSALKQAVKYLALFCALMLISWKSVDAVYALTGWHVTAVKLPVDSVLFFLSFFIQHKFIFPAGPKK